MNMTATMEHSILDSIIKQAINLPEALRLVLADQVVNKAHIKQISLVLSQNISEIRTVRQSAESLRRRTGALPLSTRFSVEAEVKIEQSCQDCLRIIKKLKKSFSAIREKHFWLSLKVSRINKLLDSSRTDMEAVFSNLRRFYYATQWQKDTYIASKNESLSEYLLSNTLPMSANDWEVFDKELSDDAPLTPVQIKAQERFLSSKHAS